MSTHNLAIIPARGGSKRIPRKNIRDFFGKPIIAYSIETALQSKTVTDVVVSTDDEEIATIARQYGAEVPFMRSKKNSSDFAGTVDVVLEVLEELEKIGRTYSNVCCIYPTAPLLSTSTIKEALHLMQENYYDSVFPVSPYQTPIQRALTVDQNGSATMIWPENRTKRSQDLAAAYFDAGQFYWLKVDAVLLQKKIYMDNSGCVIINPMAAQDIDNLSDWQLAEIKYQLLKQATK